jgi:hypothetical protein
MDRIDAEKQRKREQRQREVEAERKDAGLPPLYPEARRVVDTNDAYIMRTGGA